MNILELYKWIKNSKYVETENAYEYSNGTRWETRIYKNNGSFYRMDFANDIPLSSMTKEKILIGIYNPEKFVKFCRIVEIK